MGGFLAYDPTFAGGVFVAVGDVNGDGVDDVVTAPGETGGPHVRVFDISGDPSAPTEIAGFFAYPPSFQGGVRVAAVDLNGDGHAEVITGAGPGGGPHVRIFDLSNPANPVELDGFFAYAPGFTGGVFVGTGDVTGDGSTEIVTGPGAGGGPHVRVFMDAGGAFAPLADFFAYGNTFTGGVRVAVGDTDGDGAGEVITGSGPGGGPHVRAFAITGGSALATPLSFFAYDPSFTGGIFIGGFRP